MTSALRVRSEMRKPLAARSPVSAPIRTSLHPLLRLQQTAGNRAVARLHTGGYLQAKLAIGAPGDVYEEEADRVASQVMRQIGPGIPTLQRQVEPEEEEEELLQPRRASPIPTVFP